MRRIAIALSLLAALSACETVNSDGWTGGASTPFSQAEETCEEQVDKIEDETRKPIFFTECMRAFGWEPKPGVVPNT